MEDREQGDHSSQDAGDPNLAIGSIYLNVPFTFDKNTLLSEKD